MKRTAMKILCALALALPLTGCFAMTHTVGNGGSGGSQVSQRTWYLLWGLIPLNEADSQELASGSTDYTVHTERDVLDIVLNVFTGWLSLVSQSQELTR